MLAGKTPSIILSCLLAAALHAAPARAAEVKVGELSIDHAWSRATPGGAKVGAGYLAITNNGSAPDRLIGGTTPEARKLEVHEMSMDNGVMKMRQLAGGLPVEPGKTVVLAPGGYHLMFVDLAAPLRQGGKVTATLEFEKAGKVEVTFDVLAAGARGAAGASPEHEMGAHPEHKM